MSILLHQPECKYVLNENIFAFRKSNSFQTTCWHYDMILCQKNEYHVVGTVLTLRDVVHHVPSTTSKISFCRCVLLFYHCNCPSCSLRYLNILLIFVILWRFEMLIIDIYSLPLLRDLMFCANCVISEDVLICLWVITPLNRLRTRGQNFSRLRTQGS